MFNPNAVDQNFIGLTLNDLQRKLFLVVARLNELFKGGNRFSVMVAPKQFKEVVECNNQYHACTPHHFAIVWLLIQHRLAW